MQHTLCVLALTLLASAPVMAGEPDRENDRIVNSATISVRGISTDFQLTQQDFVTASRGDIYRLADRKNPDRLVRIDGFSPQMSDALVQMARAARTDTYALVREMRKIKGSSARASALQAYNIPTAVPEAQAALTLWRANPAEGTLKD